MLGPTIGPCRMLDKLGEGGMVVVYRARHDARAQGGDQGASVVVVLHWDKELARLLPQN